MIRIILTTRQAVPALAAAILIAALSGFVGTTVVRIDLSPAHPARLPLCEPCAIIAATMLAILLRPRLWEWERAAASHRARAVAVATSAAATALPALCALAVAPRLSNADVPWAWLLANTIALAALVQLTTPRIGALWAGVVAIGIWLICGVLHNVTPALSGYLPTSSSIDTQPHWILTSLLVAAALTIHARTLGTTAHTHNAD